MTDNQELSSVFTEIYEKLEQGQEIPQELKAQAERHGIRISTMKKVVQDLEDDFDNESL